MSATFSGRRSHRTPTDVTVVRHPRRAASARIASAASSPTRRRRGRRASRPRVPGQRSSRRVDRPVRARAADPGGRAESPPDRGESAAPQGPRRGVPAGVCGRAAGRRTHVDHALTRRRRRPPASRWTTPHLKNARHAARRERRRVLTRSAWFTRSSHVAMPGRWRMSRVERCRRWRTPTARAAVVGTSPHGEDRSAESEPPADAALELDARPATHTTSSECNRVFTSVGGHVEGVARRRVDSDSDRWIPGAATRRRARRRRRRKHRSRGRRPSPSAATVDVQGGGNVRAEGSTRASNVSWVWRWRRAALEGVHAACSRASRRGPRSIDRCRGAPTSRTTRRRSGFVFVFVRASDEAVASASGVARARGVDDGVGPRGKVGPASLEATRWTRRVLNGWRDAHAREAPLDVGTNTRVRRGRRRRSRSSSGTAVSREGPARASTRRGGRARGLARHARTHGFPPASLQSGVPSAPATARWPRRGSIRVCRAEEATSRGVRVPEASTSSPGRRAIDPSSSRRAGGAGGCEGARARSRSRRARRHQRPGGRR